ncbi:MAG: hypothetical protein AB7O97_18550 [Planctomycetota bacterium]
MTRRRSSRSSPAKLAGALAVLVAGAAVCWQGIASNGSRAVEPVADDEPWLEDDADDGTDPDDGPAAEVLATELDDRVGDLLALVGSHDPAIAVTQAFATHSAVVGPADGLLRAPAPGGETAGGTQLDVRAEPGGTRPRAADGAPPSVDGDQPLASRWTGPPPAPLHVTFVMVGADIARASVDGAIVGVGDELAGAAGTVVEIRREGIRVQTSSRSLFYELADPVPREYRAEAARRAAAARTDPSDPTPEESK